MRGLFKYTVQTVNQLGIYRTKARQFYKAVYHPLRLLCKKLQRIAITSRMGSRVGAVIDHLQLINKAEVSQVSVLVMQLATTIA